MTSMSKKTNWFEFIDFYALSGLVCIWISAWLFMLPHKMEVNSPLFDNIWGTFFHLLGISEKRSTVSQQLPDFMSGIISLVLIAILQFRNIISLTTNKKSAPRPFVIMFDLLNIFVHTLYFSILIKIFLFPNFDDASSIIDIMKMDFATALFFAFSAAAMIFGVQAVAKLFFCLLVALGIVKNISIVSDFMGITGFIAILFSVAGFYLEFCAEKVLQLPNFRRSLEKV